MARILALLILFFSSFSLGINCAWVRESLIKVIPVHPISAYKHFRHSAPEYLQAIANKIEESDISSFKFHRINEHELVLFPDEQSSPLLVQLAGRGGYLSDMTGTRIGFWNTKVKTLFPTIEEIPPGHQKEIEAIRVKTREYERQQQNFWDTVTFAPRLLFYPYALTTRAALAVITGKVFEGRQILKAAFGRILRDGVAAYGYYLLINTGNHPGLIFVESLENHDGEIDLDPYLKKTDEILGPPPEGITLFIDGLKEDDPIAFTSKKMFDRLYGQDKNAHYVKVKNFSDLIEQVKNISEKTGQKIARIELLGHGNYLKNLKGDSASVIWHVGDSTLTQEANKTRDTIKLNAAIFKAILKKSGELTLEKEKEIDSNLEKNLNKIIDLKELPNLSKYFTKAAQVRFISCRPGAGPAGKEFMHNFGKQVVGDVLGKIASATRIIKISDLDIPEEELKKRKEVQQSFEKWLNEKKENKTFLDKVKAEFIFHAEMPLLLGGGGIYMFEEHPGEPIQVYDFKTKRWTFSSDIPIKPRR